MSWKDDMQLGRGEHDHLQLFPTYTQASAASTSEIEINGKTLHIWEFGQLENLTVAVLRQRIMDIRDAVGEAKCPPKPTAQRIDMIKWILKMQEDLTSKPANVPLAFVQEATAPDEAPPPVAYTGMYAFDDQVAGVFEGSDRVSEARLGGDRKRHFDAKTNMMGTGLSHAEPRGIVTLKNEGEGRRCIGCKDSILEHRRHDHAVLTGNGPEPDMPELAMPTDTFGGHSVRSVLNPESGGATTAMLAKDPHVEPHIGGTRRKHIEPQTNMAGPGVAHETVNVFGSNRVGRVYLDGFRGGSAAHKGEDQGYKGTWRQNPSKLKGTSLLV